MGVESAQPRGLQAVSEVKSIAELNQRAHRRFNPLTRQWLLVSPHRTQRPWQGHTESSQHNASPLYDPSCYLCPGNTRSGGVVNPDYTGTFAFDNDFPALRLEAAPTRFDKDHQGLLVAETETGVCRVLCFSPRHDLAVPLMSVPEIRGVVDAWIAETERICARPEINYVQVFENRGAIMGCSNPHPHCQIWATATVPNEPRLELYAQREHFSGDGSCLLCDYLNLELRNRERIVCENDCFVALVPFWAVWPFETLVLSKRHFASMPNCTGAERTALAGIMKHLTTRYDNLFQVSFPYSMGFHGAPSDGNAHPEWHFHAHYLPPLLRSATVRKFMVGFELLAQPQRDITPESAAERLRALPADHYLTNRSLDERATSVQD